MKKQILLIISMCFLFHFSNAEGDPKTSTDSFVSSDKSYLFQTPQNTIDGSKTPKGKMELGIRFWDEIGIDFTYNLAKNRIHATGTFDNNFRINVYYDWIFNVSSAPGLALYVGAGAAVKFTEYAPFGLGANLGVQYSFAKAPIAIGFDWRPTWYLASNSYYSGNDFALMVRYKF
ncbi:porin family protein [Flammeovirga kamogawensis]|uniref:Porin family protein n=1 Tax=Flammeovirga kamogawensis TaxID=373891 RepID=A0ABX8H1D9_9BACT|nr:porin family protein [Flammeovirga kamogawensis]MBB6462400.1 hypothetical protein [Flammeovirga kamogawensis]QWG09513.1 porin family protein [Flammeovirga kamogawensis]TRX65029.1 porin family protein [Flammeovirga kamogawensis]